jgi:exodeoxyribonuclease V alpha subunit
VNETTKLFRAHPHWSALFAESDRLLVDSLIRVARESNVPVDDAVDGDLAFAMLSLARAVRLEHVALSLSPDALARFVAEQAVGTVEHDEDPDVARIVAALSPSRGPLTAALIETVALTDPVAVAGPPIVVSYRDGVPLYAHLRRLGHAEWRLSAALLRAAETAAGGRLGALTLPPGLPVDDVTRGVTTRVLAHRISVVTGGPGTGKTTAVARMLHTLGDLLRDHRARIATAQDGTSPVVVGLCAPTAKAAVRLRDALARSFSDLGTTLEEYGDVITLSDRSGSVHRLLSLRPDLATSSEPLDVDLVIVDEMSMLELPLLDQLIARLPSEARVVLVGDPDQLASVNVGAALRDVVDAAQPGDPLNDVLTTLTTNHRSNVAIQALAAAVNSGNGDTVAAVVAAHADAVHVGTERSHALAATREWAGTITDAALADDAATALDALSEHVVLCATREGPGSVAWWRAALEGDVRRRSSSVATFAPGTPVLVTRNEHQSENPGLSALANGDVGVALERDGDTVVAFPPTAAPRVRRTYELHDAESAWSITIHKSQGSEYEHVTVSLPDTDVRILTRELLYTAVTRARTSIDIVADDAVWQRALARQITRVSGLAERVRALRDTASQSK